MVDIVQLRKTTRSKWEGHSLGTVSKSKPAHSNCSKCLGKVRGRRSLPITESSAQVHPAGHSLPSAPSGEIAAPVPETVLLLLASPLASWPSTKDRIIDSKKVNRKATDGTPIWQKAFFGGMLRKEWPRGERWERARLNSNPRRRGEERGGRREQSLTPEGEGANTIKKNYTKGGAGEREESERAKAPGGEERAKLAMAKA